MIGRGFLLFVLSAGLKADCHDIMFCCVWERVNASVYTAAYQAFRENSCLRKNLMDSDVLLVVSHEV